MVKVFYNGLDAFSGIAATPLVAITDDFINYGQRWGATQAVSLKGMITGVCDNYYQDILVKQSGLFNNFAQDFKNLEIYQDNALQFSGAYSKINNINFEQSAYGGRGVNFTIDINTFQPELFSGTFGVIDPVSSIKYSEQQNSTVNITRTFSAKGFNTSNSYSNALDNARNYVQSLTGQNLQTVPAFITGLNLSLSALCPRKVSETIDRLDSTYSVVMDYVLRKNKDGSCSNSSYNILSYSIDVGYDDDKGVYSASLNGNINGTICGNITGLRNDLLAFDPYPITLTEFTKTTNYNFLNPIPESSSVSENETDSVINFSYKYTSDPLDTKLDSTVSISEEYTSDKISVNYNGILTARGPQKTRATKLENALSSLNVPVICNTYYVDNYRSKTGLPLNLIPKSYTVRRDLINNSNISIQATFDNTQAPPNGFKKFEWTVSITPSLYKYSPIQFLNGNNGKFNLNYYNRGQITVEGTAVTTNSADVSDAVLSEAMNKMNLYSQGFSRVLLTDKKVDRSTKSEDGYLYRFTITQTCETPIFKV